MKIPSLLYGTQTDVRKACGRVVTQLGRGAHYLDLMQPLIDTREHEGNLIIEGGRGTTGTAPHFHCYLPVHALAIARTAKRIEKSIEEAFISNSLLNAWGLMLLLTGGAAPPIIAYHQERPFLEAIRHRWAELTAEGPRYAYHTSAPRELWSVPSSITMILGRLGVTDSMVQKDFAADGIEPFMTYVRAN